MIYEEQAMTNKANDDLAQDELVWDEHGHVTKVACIFAPIEHYVPLDGMVNIPIYLVWASWVRKVTTFLSDNRYFDIQQPQNKPYFSVA